MEFITTDQRIAVENFSIGRIYTITFKDSTSITRACIGKGADYVMFQETAPKMLFTLNMQTAATVDTIEPGTGSGTYDYDDLENKPQINNVTLSGNLSSADLGLQDEISEEDPLPASYISGLATVATTGAYSDLTGLPTLGTAAAADATDFATAAQGSKADAADAAISAAATGYSSLDERLDSMDSNISGKQAALTESQLNAVNSGITSAGVAQIETNKTNILSAYGGMVGKNVVKENTVTFTGYSKVIPCEPLSGVIAVYVGNCVSTDTDASTCAMIINYVDGISSSTITISRNTSTVVQNLDLGSHVVKEIAIYSSDNYVHSANDTATYTNIMLCSQAAYTADSSYQPYATSNVELTQQTKIKASRYILDTGETQSATKTFDVSNIPNGMYMIVHTRYTAPATKYGVSVYMMYILNGSVDNLTEVKAVTGATISSITATNNTATITYSDTGWHEVTALYLGRY